MIAITGATGNIGSKIAEKLLSMDWKIRCIARGAEKLESLAAKGAETATVDLLDTPELIRTLAGARAVFAMIPPPTTTPQIFAHIRTRWAKASPRPLKRRG